jgi:hypothetical protein
VELLNRGIDPHLLRQALKDREADPEMIRVLIRYLVTKKAHFQSDREKVDWLVTHLFEVWEESDRDPGRRFDVEIEQILAGHEFPPLSPQAEDLLLEIPALLDELRFYEQFSQITESRIISQGRYLKGRFGEEFFHPKVLAAIVNYNLVLGRRMQTLLQGTMESASRSEEPGATDLPGTEETLQSDYRAISDVFAQLSKLDKEAQRTKEQKRRLEMESQARAREAAAPHPAEAKPRATDEALIEMGIDPGRQNEILRNRMKEIAQRVKASPGGKLRAWGSLVLNDWEASRRQLDLMKRLSSDSERRGLAEKSKQLAVTAEKLEDYVTRVATLF